MASKTLYNPDYYTVRLFFKCMKRFAIVIIGLLTTFCAIGQPQKLYFEPTYATGMPQSKLFSEVKYIPLETTKESLFGRIYRLIATKDYFIVFDRDTDAIYFFDKNGRFVKKYTYKGYQIRSISYDENKNALFISGLNKNYNPSQKEVQAAIDNPINNSSIKYSQAIYYDLKDVKAEKTRVLKNFEIVMANPHQFNKDQWVYSYIYANKAWKDAEDYELKIYDGKETIGAFFPYNRKTSSIYYSSPERISFFKTSDPSTLLFTRPYHYTIYQLSPDSVKELYTVIMPAANTIPNSFFTENFDSRSKLEDYKMKNSGFVWGIDNVIELEDYLFFSLDFFRSFRERNFLFDKKSKQFINLSKITSDSTNAFLPAMGYSIQYHDQDFLYTSISSASMFQNKESNAARNPVYDAALKNYFENGKSADNPVIIALRLKSNK